MRNNTRLITGIMPAERGYISFWAEDYRFTFVDSQPKKYIVNQDAWPLSFDSNYIRSTEAGFALGKTSDGHDISVYVGIDGICVRGEATVNTSAYLISQTNVRSVSLAHFFSIRFIGGTLNILDTHDSCDIDYTKEGFLLKPKNNVREFHFQLGQNSIHMRIGSDTTFGSGSSGVNVRDSGVFIDLEFEYGQPINELFKYISTIKELISFMTYRRNVGFEKIEILLEPANEHIAPAIASVHIYNEEEYTDKHSFNCLSFTDIGEKIIPLIQLLHREDTGSPTYMLGFIPKNDRSYNIFTNTMVREVCSALECELGIRKELWPVEENVLKQLEKSVKKVVKEHRASNTLLPEKTYDLIFSSISRWSLTASDKILRLYNEYRDILFFRGCYLSEDKIAAFVKYRNSITHGHYRVLSMEIAETTERLAMVVYCSIMDRLGISKDRICKLIRHKICS